jgi:hypothetical protein
MRGGKNRQVQGLLDGSVPSVGSDATMTPEFSAISRQVLSSGEVAFGRWDDFAAAAQVFRPASLPSFNDRVGPQLAQGCRLAALHRSAAIWGIPTVMPAPQPSASRSV